MALLRLWEMSTKTQNYSMRKLPKQKTCKGCKEKFAPTRPLQEACQPLCAITIVRAKADKKKDQEHKAFRRETKRRKEKIKSLSDWLKEAQTAFNAYIRERDKGQHQRHASHYRPAGNNPALRFELTNVWASCAQCNTMKSGNLIEYRIRLVKLIGADRVEWLEGPRELPRYRIEDAKRIKQEYKNKLKELKNA